MSKEQFSKEIRDNAEAFANFKPFFATEFHRYLKATQHVL
jgi:hypothetical protein